MKKRILYGAVFLMLFVLFSGCDKKKEGGTCIFYTNADGTALERECYEIKEKTQEKAALEILKKMKESPEEIDLLPAIPENVKVQGVSVVGDQIDVYFDRDYLAMNKVEETLCRAAVVQSLTQIKGVEFVAFYVENLPLTDRDGKEIGLMAAENFVENTGTTLNSYTKTTLQLYFADKKGEGLVKETREIRHDSNSSIEKLIMEQLQKGPQEEGCKATLSSKVDLQGVSIKDGVCYVNLSKEFLESVPDVEPETVVYSIVNSLTDSGKASKVQISVESKTNIKFQETVDLSKPLERNLDMVEERE